MNLGQSFVARTAVTLLFGTPRELSVEEIAGKEGIIAQFVAAAKHSFEAGFRGVELHAR